MKKTFSPLLLTVAILVLGAGSASGLDITTRLLQAKPGSWIRTYYAPAETRYVTRVTEVTGQGPNLIVTLQMYSENSSGGAPAMRLKLGGAYIKDNGIDADSPSAIPATIQVQGTEYAVTVLERTLPSGEVMRNYFSADIPVSGLVRVETGVVAGVPAAVIDLVGYGFEPEPGMPDPQAGEIANDRFGIPLP